MKTSTLVLSTLLPIFAASCIAQSSTPPAAPAAPAVPSASAAAASAPAAAAAPAMKDMADAEVRKVDKEAKKVTLKHGPIKNLDMPGMTMVFQVRDEKLFDKLVAGETIKFTAEQLQGAYVVTSVEKAESK